ncbi:Intermembrane phospholipid transport system binding protein MlaC [Burkholderiaceae bacterium]|nr:Intermembrane phospholipid transport system binding protein MlaC [Burkholderiaceae bacterium]
MLQPAPWIRATLGALMLALMAGPAAATEEAADAMIKRLANEVMEAARAPGEASDARSLNALVDRQIMPSVNFSRMTASVVGRHWRQATPEQQARLQEEFKLMLVRTYAGALTQLKDRTITVKPLRAGADDAEATVRTLVKGQGEPVAIDYRLEKTAAGWKIVDLNVMGVWLVEAYRGQFSAEINARGLDGLIATLSERNRLVAAR